MQRRETRKAFLIGRTGVQKGVTEGSQSSLCVSDLPLPVLFIRGLFPFLDPFEGLTKALDLSRKCENRLKTDDAQLTSAGFLLRL